MLRLIIIVIVLIAGCRSNRKPSDKVPMVQTETKVIVMWDTLNYVLRYCSATLEDKKLKLYIELHPDSMSDYSIEMLQKDKNFDVVVSQPWSVTDSSYVGPRFKILHQKLTLNKEYYKSNEIVQGELNLLMLGHEAYFRKTGEMNLRENWDTVHCSGFFSSIVK